MRGRASWRTAEGVWPEVGGAGSGPDRKWHVRHGDRGENQPPENGTRRETGSGGGRGSWGFASGSGNGSVPQELRRKLFKRRRELSKARRQRKW